MAFRRLQQEHGCFKLGNAFEGDVLGFRVWGLGCRVEGLGFGNLCLVQGLRACNLPVNVLGSSFPSGLTPLDQRRGGELRCH